jgi:FkbM family methyltransferase
MRSILKFFGVYLARIFSQSSLLSDGYLWCLSRFNFLTGFRHQSFLVNSIKRQKWPGSVMQCPYRVRLNGLDGQFVLLHPHAGEEDFQVILGGELNYEPEVFAAVNAIIGSHDYVLEVGANVGIFSVWMESRLRSCSKLRGMFVFEPSVEAYSRLLKNAAANDCRRLSLLNMAISDRTGSMCFFEPEGHLTNGSLSREFAASFSNVIRESFVPATTIDALAETIPDGAAVFIKIDVEGHEAGVIRGCASLFRRANVDLVIEVLENFEDDIFSSLRAVCEFEKVARLGQRDWLIRCRPLR